MIITKITIENYLCYFDKKEFELAKGLNIILGENGEGKTKFFEALDWLLNGDDRNLELLVSAKALAETELNEHFRVRVSITVEIENEKKILTKSFLVKKESDNDFSVSNYMLEGIEESRTGERSQVNGKALLDIVFPPEIRRYSMFKGEAELDIFKNADALINLINSFSTAKYYEKYSSKGIFLREKAEKAVDDATRSDLRNQQEYRRLESEIAKEESEKQKLTVFINSTEEQIKKIEEKIQDAEKYVMNAELLETINGRINHIQEKITSTESKIDENYTTSLFDENWILVNFEPIHQEFTRKVAQLSNKKRELQTEFDKKIGIKEGKNQLRAELLNHSVPLPIGVPSKAHMQEMVKDEYCKVCNRPAEVGSEAHSFMLKRLEEYIKSQQPATNTEAQPEKLFKFNYTNRLFNLGISHEDSLSNLRQIQNRIIELFDFNKARKGEIEALVEKLNKEITERESLIGSSSVGAEKLGIVLKNYNSWQRDLTNLNYELVHYNRQLQKVLELLTAKKEEKDNIDTKTANTFLITTRSILRDIEKIFSETKERKFDEFIETLENQSNLFFERINVEAFTGMIVFRRKKSSIHIELQESDGRIFHKPNQSLLTSMHIAILFAISKLANYDTDSYPMIFDAPTSSFGETKTAEFLNLLYETSNQKILLIKDFLVKDEVSNQLRIKSEFNNVKRDKAFWIHLERPFNNKSLKTLNSQVITL